MIGFRYIPTYPLFCLAAQYSLKVYERPTETERADHIRASLLHRTKAMTLKSLPLDDMNTIVFAIRGSVSFTDWGMNFRLAPASPEGFLDDPGNLCHAVCAFKTVHRTELTLCQGISKHCKKHDQTSCSQVTHVTRRESF